MLLIDNKTGVTKYYEYGRYKPSGDLGRVRRYDVPNVKIKDGRPTEASLARVFAKISRESGGRTRVEGALVRSDKFKEMNQYAQDRLKLNRKIPGGTPTISSITTAGRSWSAPSRLAA